MTRTRHLVAVLAHGAKVPIKINTAARIVGKIAKAHRPLYVGYVTGEQSLDLLWQEHRERETLGLDVYWPWHGSRYSLTGSGAADA